MPWSKRKPYIYDEEQKVPAGNLRSSLGDFFRAPIRHLKESNEKESQFEKPYRSESYQKMHLDLPWSKFQRWEDPTPGSIFGSMPSLTHTFFFGPGLCSFTGGGELEVGEWERISGFRSLTPPQSKGGEWIWQLWSSHSEIEIDIQEHGKSPKIRVRALKEFEGTALVCASCGHSGLLVDSYVMEKAGTGFVDLQLSGKQINFIDRTTNLPVESSVETTYKDSTVVSCGCVEFTCGDECDTITPVTFLAYGVNPETIVRNNNVTLTVQDGLAPYSWSVSGIGFSISALTEGLSNSLIADETACGTATVTVTDACENSDTYEVRCTYGSWQDKTAGCEFPGAFTECGSNKCYKLVGKYRQVIVYQCAESVYQHYCEEGDCDYSEPNHMFGCLTGMTCESIYHWEGGLNTGNLLCCNWEDMGGPELHSCCGLYVNVDPNIYWETWKC